jgi:spermidine/putrescine transport system permease protein
MGKKNSIFSKIYLLLIFLFLYLPIAYVMFFSFNSERSLTKFGGFSLQWYEKMFNDRTIMEAIYYTVIIAVIATIVATIVGTITAIGLSKSRKIVKEVIIQVNNLPMLNPDIVTAVGFMLLFASFKIETGFMTLLIAHIVFCIPYVMLSVMPRLRQLDPNLIEAAIDLGCTPFQALIKVIIPQIKSGIIAGALIAFTMSFDDFVISLFTTGPGVNNISIYVYSSFKRINPTINALSTLLVLVVTIVLILASVIPSLRDKRRNENEKIINTIIN